MSEYGFVYLIQEDYAHCYKIGKTKRLNERMNLFSVLLPFQISSIHTIYSKNYHHVEQFLHQHFRKKRTNGEWFDLSKEDVEWIKNESYLGENKIPLPTKTASAIKEYIQDASKQKELITAIMDRNRTRPEVREWYHAIEQEMKTYQEDIWVKPGQVFLNYYSPTRVFASIRIRTTHLSLELFCAHHPIPGTYQTEPEKKGGRQWSRFKVRKPEDVPYAIDCMKTAFNIIR